MELDEDLSVIIQDKSYDYRQKKNVHKKLAQKRCPSQINIKNPGRFFHITRGPPITVILWKENQNLQKWAICKNHEYFIKTGCIKNKDQMRTIKPL